MLASDTPSALEASDRCPRCSAPCGALNLLTSMTRYYVCGRCECRWQVSRMEESNSPSHASGRVAIDRGVLGAVGSGNPA